MSAQIELTFAAPDPEALHRRLDRLGLAVRRVRLNTNASVLMSLSHSQVLSIHQGYANAPDAVLQAIATFFTPRVRRERRREALREIQAFEIRADAAVRASRRADAPRPGDLAKTERLVRLFADLNARHFGGSLPALPIRISGRMRTRLGQLCLDPATLEPFEITMSRRHLDRHGWDEAAHTLLHEMVHLWQFACGYPVDHGPIFRSKARAVGVAPSARRSLATPSSRSKAALYD